LLTLGLGQTSSKDSLFVFMFLSLDTLLLGACAGVECFGPTSTKLDDFKTLANLKLEGTHVLIHLGGRVELNDEGSTIFLLTTESLDEVSSLSGPDVILSVLVPTLTFAFILIPSLVGFTGL